MHANLRRTLATFLVASLTTGCSARDAAPVAAQEKPPVEEQHSAALDYAPPEPAPVATSASPVPPPMDGKQEQVRVQKEAKPAAGAPRLESAASYGAIGGASGGGVGYGSGRMGAPMRRMPPADPVGSEDYKHYEANKMTLAAEDHLSTFAVDVDTASYSIARRKLLEGGQVPADAVRVEEFVNYFKYGYEGPGDERPFAVHLESAPSPFNPGRTLLRVGVQGKQVARSQRKPAHLVFLVDVSGSMNQADKLPLAQRSLRILVDNLGESDTVALVTYAGSTRVVLEPTAMNRKGEIYAAIDSLSAGGSTAMGSGLELAYGLALKNVKPGSESRVIVLSDGDANVGPRTQDEIHGIIAGHVKEGVTLSTIGFGMGNYKDSLMEQLANKGNGNNYYIDSLSQAKRVFQEQLGGTLEVIAQDVKIQVDFDPAQVLAYRLVGYENRDIADNDFRDDKVDAGEIGAGHAVTAVYELELKKGEAASPLATVRVRAKKPRAKEAAEHAYPLPAAARRASFASASESFRFAVAVMAFAEILRKSPYSDGWRLDQVLDIARGATPRGSEERVEFAGLVEAAMKRRASR